MNPYQTLANAIIRQAAIDHQKAVKFLREHEHTAELDDIVAAQVKARKDRIKKRREEGEPSVEEKKSAEEKLLNRILEAEDMLEDTERFFRSGWFSQLTDLDGFWLLNKLKEMEEGINERQGISGAGD